MAIYQLGDLVPAVAASAYVADNAQVIGNVSLADGVTVWFGVTIRGDNDRITIEENCNVQDGAILHTDKGHHLHLEKNVSVGHQAMLHGCKVGEGSLIGIQAVILNGAVIGKNCLVGAGAVVTEGKEFPDNSLILGAPAKVVRTLTEANTARLIEIAGHYVERGDAYKNTLKRIG